MPNTEPLTKVEKQSRIVSLDVIRGFAILGILLMNIQSFSMIGQAYLNPMAYGDMNGLNKWVWVFSHVFADQKFMTIFSMLFGASTIMIAEKVALEKGSSLGIHYSRNFWLLIIGLIHAYVFWYGDILTPYAVCAFLLYPFRKLSIKKLLILGVFIFSISSVIELSIGYFESIEAANNVSSFDAGWNPSQRIIDAEINAYLGDFASQMSQRIKTATMMHTVVFILFYFWRISGLMLIGMALFKSGFLSGKLETKSYQKILKLTAPIGFLLVIYGVTQNFEDNWSPGYAQYVGSQFNYWGSLLIAISYISAVVLCIHTGKFKKATEYFASVGRMALSNYLIQTLICTFIFYGFGLGFFCQVERIYQLLIVIGVWTFQIFSSTLWLKHFRFGLFEWLWRSLTYMKIQRLLK